MINNEKQYTLSQIEEIIDEHLVMKVD